MNNDKRTTRELESSNREERFTPGEWEAEKNHVVLKYAPGIIIASCNTSRPAAEANARLIANAPKLFEENTRLKERIEVLERAFYMDICRAYNAGKQNAFEMVAEGKRNGESLEAFKSSHEYFIGEFPTFKTNVP